MAKSQTQSLDLDPSSPLSGCPLHTLSVCVVAAAPLELLLWAVSITHTASAKVLELKAFTFPLTGKLVVPLLCTTLCALVGPAKLHCEQGCG